MSTTQTIAPGTDREIILTRMVRAPRVLVWQACTLPAHIDKWWGPNGFTNKTISMDLRVGGVWKYTMTAADGTVFANLITYKEVVPLERLVYDHGDWEDPNQFEGSLTFTEVEGGTLITLHSIFPSKEARDMVVEKYGAIEGGKQTLARMDEFVKIMAEANGDFDLALPTEDALEMTRTFKAPRALVYRAWTEPELIRQWFGGPDPFLTAIAELDVRKDGRWRLVMRGPDGTDYPLHGTFTEVVPNERLVFFGTLIDHPASFHAIIRGNFPKGHPDPSPEFEWVVTFADAPEGTLLTMRMLLPDRIHRDVHLRMGTIHGWAESMQRLTTLLATP